VGPATYGAFVTALSAYSICTSFPDGENVVRLYE
jgi:hypothetical protein